MGMNETPAGERVHIGLFGRRNAGKSSLINALTGQALSIVSDVAGTTTDPVYKAMELLPLGPVMLIDTAGLDELGELGGLRVKKTLQVLNKTDVAVVVCDAREGITADDQMIIDRCRAKKIPLVIVMNKIDLASGIPARQDADAVFVSAATGENIAALKEKIAQSVKASDEKLRLVADLVAPSDFVVLVVPIDKAAPKGRLILPQQQTIRDLLEADAVSVVVKEYELRDTLMTLGKKPRLVITDSQVFAKVSADTPQDIPLTSFSILFARYKGMLEEAVRGAQALDTLTDGDRVLIAEGCTHHRQCDDIGTVKLPRWIGQHTGKKLDFTFTSGGEFPDDLSSYKLVVHCGGCMLGDREVKFRTKCAAEQNIPITNYGIAIAHMQGILKRSVAVFPHIAAMLP
ncbi:MAG: [FeFe] hydrogenase H-cluster maturation GTPase HydF [Oscillospiraceae bacterium]